MLTRETTPLIINVLFPDSFIPHFTFLLQLVVDYVSSLTCQKICFLTSVGIFVDNFLPE